MVTNTSAALPQVKDSASTRAMAIVLTAMLGFTLIGGVGFAHISAVHNAAHDYRHSMGFPCH